MFPGCLILTLWVSMVILRLYWGFGLVAQPANPKHHYATWEWDLISFTVITQRQIVYKDWRKPIFFDLSVVNLKMTLRWLFKMCCLQFSSLFDWHLEIVEADEKGLFAHCDAGGGQGAGRKRGKEKKDRTCESKASNLSPPPMTHASISDWVDYSDSSLCSCQLSLCITFLWWRR